MNEIILTTPNELREILNECLANRDVEPKQIQEPEPPKLLYSIHALASFLGCSNMTAFKLKKSGRVRYMQFGRKLVFNSAEVLEDLKKKKR